MAKKARTVARSAKTGRFVKKTTAKKNPKTTVVESVKSPKKKAVKVVRSAKTGRFLKKSSARRRPDVAKPETVKR